MRVKSLLGWSCSAIFAAATVGAQTQGAGQNTTPPSGQQPSTQQSNQTQQTNRTQQNQNVTFTGCVYQVSDQPNVFALQRISDQMTTGTSGQSGAAASSGASGTTTAGSPGSSSGTSAASGRTSSGTSTGTAGTSGSTSAMNQKDLGGWYRLSGTQDLKQYAGRAVRITGSVTPGKDEKGADIIIHRIEPQRVTVTSVDLKPAPQLMVQSVTQAQGTCSAQGQNR